MFFKYLIHKDSKHFMKNMTKNIDNYLSTLTTKEQFYFDMIDKFFSTSKCKYNDVIKMVNIIDGKSYVSLRILDWFVTRYSHKFKICINTDNIEYV